MTNQRSVLRVFVVLTLLLAGLAALPVGAVEADDELLFAGMNFGEQGAQTTVTTVRPDGQVGATMASTSRPVTAARWSRDGTRVALVESSGSSDAPDSLVVVNRDGTGRTQLAQGGALYSVSWSPDGSHVAAGGTNGIIVVPADGSTSADQIVQADVNGLDWHPTDDLIVYSTRVSDDGEFPPRASIRTVRSDGTAVTTLNDASAHDDRVLWSPDGTRVGFLRWAYTGEDFRKTQLRSVAADGSDHRRHAGAQELDDHDMMFSYDWHPDGTRIVFSSAVWGVGIHDAKLYVARTDQTQVQVLIDSAEDISDMSPVWSPDGDTVAFNRRQIDDMAPGHMPMDRGIWFVDADGTNPRQVFREFEEHGILGFAPRVEDAPPPPDDENRRTVDVTAPPGDEPVTVTADLPAGTVAVTFTQVTSSGRMTVVQREPMTGERGPAFSVLDTAFDISVAGVEFGGAEVCVPFDAAEAAAAGVSEHELGLYHVGADGIRRNVTTSVDTDEGVICGRVSSFSPFLVGHARLDRLAGANRAATAAAISSRTFQAGVGIAYVATQADYPDALAGGPAAAGAGGPILLVARDEIPAVTAAELTRLRPTQITVLGGEGVVSAAVQNQLGGFTDGAVTRIAGAGRYETAADISAEHFEPGVDVAYVATGLNFPDALAGGAAAAAEGGPVLLVRTNDVPPATAAELERLNPGEIVLLGGTAAVSDAVRDELAGHTDGEVTRVSGDDRYGTAAAVLARFDAPAEVVFVATGAAFPDALASVPAAGLTASPLALVRPNAVPDPVRTQLNRLSPDHLFVLGGHAAVAADVEAPLAQTLR